MKLRSLFLTMLILTALVLGSVFAQDMPFDPCFNLSADDCAYIDEISANGMGDVSSFTLSLDINFNASGLPDESMQSIEYIQTGSIDFGPSDGFLIPINMAGSFDVSFAQNGDDLQTYTIDFALVDDWFYFADPMTGDWGGVNLTEVFTSPELQDMLAPIMEGMSDGSSDNSTGMDAEALMPLADLLNLPGLLNYERDGDDFIFTIDLSALQALLDPENEELLNTIITAASELDPTLAFMIPAIPALIQEGTIVVTQTVNPDLEIVDRVQLDVNLSANLGAIMGDPQLPATEVELSLDARLSNFDSAPTPEAPAEFEDVTQDFLDGLSGVAGGM